MEMSIQEAQYDALMNQVNEMADKLARLRNMKVEIAPLLDEIEALEKEVKAEILETGELPEVDGVTVKIRNGYTRSSWDNKALRGYAVNNPEIMQFCKESQIGPSVVLSYSAA